MYALTESTKTDEYHHRRATSRDVADDGPFEADVVTCDILYSHVRTSEESIACDTRQGKDRHPVRANVTCVRALHSRSTGIRTAEDGMLFPRQLHDGAGSMVA